MILCWGVFQYSAHRKSMKILDHLMEENRLLKDENIRIAIEAQERERREIGQDMHDDSATLS